MSNYTLLGLQMHEATLSVVAYGVWSKIPLYVTSEMFHIDNFIEESIMCGYECWSNLMESNVNYLYLLLKLFCR